MEQRQDVSPVPPRQAADEDDQNPGKLKRISHETKGLVEDVKSWVELRMTLTQMDVEDKIDARVNRALIGGVIGGLAFLGLSFALVAAALAIGSWLGHNTWGFLIVAGLLFIISLILQSVKPRIVSVTGSERGTRSNG